MYHNNAMSLTIMAHIWVDPNILRYGTFCGLALTSRFVSINCFSSSESHGCSTTSLVKFAVHEAAYLLAYHAQQSATPWRLCHIRRLQTKKCNASQNTSSSSHRRREWRPHQTECPMNQRRVDEFFLALWEYINSISFTIFNLAPNCPTT